MEKVAYLLRDIRSPGFWTLMKIDSPGNWEPDYEATFQYKDGKFYDANGDGPWTQEQINEADRSMTERNRDENNNYKLNFFYKLNQ